MLIYLLLLLFIIYLIGRAYHLVIEKELCEVAQVLAVDLLLLAVHLEKRHVAAAVNLVTRGVPQLTLVQVPLQLLLLPQEREAELAEVQLVAGGHLRRERGEVPANIAAALSRAASQ